MDLSFLLVIIGSVIFGYFNALIASKKGFSPVLWFFCAGPVGLLFLYLLPSATVVRKSDFATYLKRRNSGNGLGFLIFFITLALIVILALAIKS